MSKFLALMVAAVFAISGSAFAASHVGSKMDDKKMEKKDEKKAAAPAPAPDEKKAPKDKKSGHIKLESMKATDKK